MDPISLPFLLFVIFVALVFDYINGFHDAANSIATVVSTRVLSPGKAVIWAAFFNFIAAFGFGTHVAKMVGTGMVHPTAITATVILAGLLGAITWNLLTWFWGLPSSSSHALIGGLGGAALAYGGSGALNWAGYQKTVIFIFVAPVLGLVLGLLMMVLVLWLNRRSHPSAVDRHFRLGQLVSAALYSLAHGVNDAQKTMGVIVALLLSGGLGSWAYKADGKEIAWWVILVCHAAIAAGTLSGGWRIVKTMGQKITKLKPIGGFCAETAGAISLFFSSSLGIPVSTTHTITAAIMGVGAVNNLSAVKWGIAENIIWAWVLTIPASAGMAALFQFIFAHFGL